MQLTNTELQMLQEALLTKCDVILRKIVMMNKANAPKQENEQAEETKKEEE